MKMIPLNVSTREKSGKGVSKRARRAGLVPGVVYGPGHQPVHVTFAEREFGTVIHGAQGEHAIVDLKFSDQPDLGGPVLCGQLTGRPGADFRRLL